MNNTRTEIRRLMIALNKIDGIYYLIAKKSGTKENMLSLLYALSDGKSHSQKQICEEWLIPRTTINTVVKECINSGYVTLTSTGKKEKNIELTDAGKTFTQKLLAELFEMEDAAIQQTIEKYASDFISAIEYFTDVMNQKLNDYTGEKQHES
ncbi:MAG: MarR family transcriptional regulator [Butyricicoccus pullicaecorum]|nr:MarR family transcriptional regulator [Butyricicoccus pullicaecorum]